MGVKNVVYLLLVVLLACMASTAVPQPQRVVRSRAPARRPPQSPRRAPLTPKSSRNRNKRPVLPPKPQLSADALRNEIESLIRKFSLRAPPTPKRNFAPMPVFRFPPGSRGKRTNRPRPPRPLTFSVRAPPRPRPASSPVFAPAPPSRARRPNRPRPLTTFVRPPPTPRPAFNPSPVFKFPPPPPHKAPHQQYRPVYYSAPQPRYPYQAPPYSTSSPSYGGHY